MPRLREPSLKQKRWVQEYLKHGNKFKAAQVAYPTATPDTQNHISVTQLKKPLVVQYARELMDKAGISDEKIAEKLNLIIESGTNQNALAQSKPDHALKALEMAIKVKDLFPAEKKQIESKTATVNLDLKGKSPEELQHTLDALTDEIRNFKKLISVEAQIQDGVETL